MLTQFLSKIISLCTVSRYREANPKVSGNAWALVMLLLFSTVVSASEKINSVRVWQAPDSTRVVFDLSGPVDHSIFTLDKPNRVVIDLKGTLRTKALFSIDLKDSSIAKVRSAMQNKQDLRVVLDLKTPLKPKSFLLKPNAQYGHRLVLDLGFHR